jgi:uncharacterized membrane protein YdbT with pleckstrin-like domain
MNTLNLERTIMTDKPSQWLNFGYFLLMIIGLVVFPPVGVGLTLVFLWRVLVIYFWKWNISLDSIVEVKGVLNVNTDEIYLFRIKDIHLYQPFLYRLVGLSKLYLVTSDKTRPVLLLDGIKDGESKREMFKKMTMSNRKREGVREFDFR